MCTFARSTVYMTWTVNPPQARCSPVHGRRLPTYDEVFLMRDGASCRGAHTVYRTPATGGGEEEAEPYHTRIHADRQCWTMLWSRLFRQYTAEVTLQEVRPGLDDSSMEGQHRGGFNYSRGQALRRDLHHTRCVAQSLLYTWKS